MDAIHCLKTRRSIRTFAPGDVPAAVVADLVDCARLAPTAMNKQPWTFLVFRDEAVRYRIVELAGHGEFLRTAPVAIAVCCDEWDYWKEDGSAATMALLLAAHAHGLGACWLSMEPQAYAAGVKALLGIPEQVHLLAIVALGRPGESPAPEKKPLGDVLRFDRW
jgi:nitroreductase